MELSVSTRVLRLYKVFGLVFLFFLLFFLHPPADGEK